MGEVNFHIIPVYGEVVKEPTINFHTILLQGGKGSGNFGHSGIPGQVGGSGGGGGSIEQIASQFDVTEGPVAAGPVSAKVYRVGGTTESEVYFAGDHAGALAYGTLHEGQKVVAYDVETKNTLVAMGHWQLYPFLNNGKSWQDAIFAADKRSGFKSSKEAARTVQHKMMLQAAKKGYDSVIFKSPPAPAKTELVVINKSSAAITISDQPTTQKEIHFHIIHTQQSSLQDNFNPNHDDKGRFASGSGSGGAGEWKTMIDEGPPGWQAREHHLTRTDRGFADPKLFIDIKGERGEHNLFKKSPTGAYKQKDWQKFVQDIKENGVKHPVTIFKEKDGKVQIHEGNHRLRAAIEAGVSKIPVDIRYFGNSQRSGLIIDPSTQ